MDSPLQEELLRRESLPLSVVLPTYNESQNISHILESITNALPENIDAEIIVIDDNSTDGTGEIATQCALLPRRRGIKIQVRKRASKMGLSSAILEGFNLASGDIILVMDSDMSHPPQTIPSLLTELQKADCDIVVASRYIKGGSIVGWPFKRRILSKGATNIARYGLGIQISDPMSGFFAFRRSIIRGLNFEGIGYKMLLEMLVKAKGARIKEVPYVFRNRRLGSSKLDSSVVIDYLRSVWSLYRFGKARSQNKPASVSFLSKAGRFYTVGATGLVVNYLVSILFRDLMPDIWFLYTTILGIVFSISSNFILNKVWTFEDRKFDWEKTPMQFGMFLGFSSLGAALQLLIVYLFVQVYAFSYPASLVTAVAAASIGNFLLNKKWTFKEKVWS